jgi:predicted small lipoprotein YifL
MMRSGGTRLYKKRPYKTRLFRMRLAVAAALAASLCLAGCGRKNGLDAPPSALPAAPQSSAQQPPGFGDPGPIFAGPPTLGSDSSASSPPPPQAQQQAAQTQPAPKKTFFLDPLINQ